MVFQKRGGGGNYEWFKVSEAGDSVNWLEHDNTEIQKYFIFDPLSIQQVEIAKKISELNSPFISLVMIGGDIIEASNKVGSQVTYLNDSMIREYDLQYTPVVIRRGYGEFRNFYRKVRFNVDEVKIEDVISELSRNRNGISN